MLELSKKYLQKEEKDFSLEDLEKKGIYKTTKCMICIIISKIL